MMELVRKPEGEAQDVPEISRKLRRARARRLALVLAVGVGVPTLLAAVYYGLVASPEYQSVAVLSVETAEHPAVRRVGRNDGPSPGVTVVRDFVRSRAMLEHLVREHRFVEHYTGGKADIGSRLPADAGSEELYDYYLAKVEAAAEPDSSVITIRVLAFTPERARAFARAIVAAAEEKVAALTSRDRLAVVGPAEEDVARARAALARAGAAESEAHRIATEDLEAARSALARVRHESARHGRHLVTIATPSLPDEPARPKRLWSVATVFFTSFALLAVLALLGAAVREHADF